MFEEMNKRTADIGVKAEGESAYPIDVKEMIESVRAEARLKGKDEDEAVREFHELRAKSDQALKQTEEEIAEELKKAA